MSGTIDQCIYLLLGSNQNDPMRQLDVAVIKLKESGLNILNRSSIYKTAPWGITNQPSFYNQVILIKSVLPAPDLLKLTQSVEIAMGRVREQKWGPRVIDIDILFIDNIISSSPSLTLPHPEIQNRRFTLVPLVEIAPDFIHPVLNKSLYQLLEECEDSSEVTQVTN